jgi:phage gpG-like protein
MGLVIIKDRTSGVLDAVKRLLKQECLVGVPDINAMRDPDPSDPKSDINNAQLGYIHEFGSPAANIPARPFLVPGVESVKDQISAKLKKAGERALSGEPSEIDRQLNAVGLIAANAVQQKLVDGPFAPLAPLTIANRKAKGRTSKQPLIDTGALRQSITYAIRNR